MKPVEYFAECISNSAEEVGAVLTVEQVNQIAESVLSAHENYGQAFHVSIEPGWPDREVKNLKKLLNDERGKVICKRCNGCGLYWGNKCWTCKGAGRVLPEHQPRTP